MLPPGPSQTALERSLFIARWLRSPTELLDALHATYGDTFTVQFPFPRTNVVMTGDPDVIRDVFTLGPGDAHAGEANAILRPFLGDHSLLLLDGKEHIRQRKLLLPPFHGERMQAYGSAMCAVTDATIDRYPVGEAFGIDRSMRAITLEIILRTVFGIEDGRSSPLFGLLSQTLDAAASPFLLLPFLQVDLGPLSPWGRFVARAAKVDALLQQTIRHAREHGTRGRTDVLALLLDARDEEGGALSDVELRDQLLTLLVAGHETTATALSWAVRLLCEHRDVEARLRAELAGSSRTPDAIAALPFLDATVKETLRLRPVIPMVGRRLLRPMRLGRWELPEGTFVAPSIWLAHHREDVFPNPRAFEPERFLRRRPAASEWFPFGGGIRRCIGMAFALHEMKMVLATLLARTELALAAGAPIRIVRRSITLAPAEGLRVVVRRRIPRLEAGRSDRSVADPPNALA